MRKLFIRFSGEGEYLREIDEDRHYFLFEAEQILSTIREKIQKQKRNVQPKMFECWIDGQPIVVAYVTFEETITLEKQLEGIIKEYTGWDEDTRYTYINKLKSYAEEERQLFFNKEFQAFAIRFDQVFGNKKAKPFPLVWELEKIKKLFDEMYGQTVGFYSKIEEMMGAIKTTNETLVQIVECENGKDLIDTVNEWLADESNFQLFIKHVTANYQSIPINRIEPISVRFKPYQDLQLFLFNDYASTYGFTKAYEQHIEFQQELLRKYNEILFQGFVIKTDDMVESLIIKPIINKYRERLEGELRNE